VKQGQSSTPVDILVDIFNPYNSAIGLNDDEEVLMMMACVMIRFLAKYIYFSIFYFLLRLYSTSAEGL